MSLSACIRAKDSFHSAIVFTSFSSLKPRPRAFLRNGSSIRSVSESTVRKPSFGPLAYSFMLSMSSFTSETSTMPVAFLNGRPYLPASQFTPQNTNGRVASLK
jgi:hypothetical protein